MIQILIIKIILLIILGSIIGAAIQYFLGQKKVTGAKAISENIISDAKKTADATKKEMLLEAKDEIYKSRHEFELETKTRRSEIQNLEKRLVSKEESLEKKLENLEKKDEKLNNKIKQVESRELEIDEIVNMEKLELEKISNLSTDQARDILLTDLKKDLTHEFATEIRNHESKLKEEQEKISREILSVAIQRCAADHVSETTVTVVTLPNDEMKGRIIGREGRNIRMLENLTGVELIIDDTPEAVVLSCFDPVRREIARIALEKLISDGRIHPTRIEEQVEKASTEVDKTMKETGEQAAFEVGITNMHPEMIMYLGRLKYRTSYGQNVLTHSIEVAKLAGYIAEELGADVKIAKRGGFLHDIGKSIDRDVEGSHVEIGVNIARRLKESKAVIHCIHAHHNDVPPETVEAVIVQAADAISAARPGARRETLEAYIQRLRNLEEIASSFEGIEKSYAVQAGRELRIMVKPDKISEDNVKIMARDIAKRIESEMEYPGTIKVNIVRETRAIDYAK